MLTPAITLDLGDLRYTTHVVRLRLVRTRLPDVDRLEVDLPAGVRLDAAPGDDVTLALDGGEGEETVFTGVVRQVVARPHVVTVVADGGGARLATSRPCASLEATTAGDVVRQLCSEAEVDVAAIDDGPRLALYLADGRSTAGEEIARLAALTGGYGRFDGDGKLSVGADVGEERALRFGREPVDLAVTTGAAIEATLEGSPVFGAPGGEEGDRWPIADGTAGGAPAEGFAWRRSVAGVGLQDARAAAEAASSRRAAAVQPFRLRTWLVPAVAPLDRLSLQDAPDRAGLDGALVTHVVHQIGPRGAWTDLRGVASSASSGLGGLL